MQGKDKLEEILSEYFQNLMKDINLQYQEVWLGLNKKKTQNYARRLNDCDYCMRIMGNRR